MNAMLGPARRGSLVIASALQVCAMAATAQAPDTHRHEEDQGFSYFMGLGTLHSHYEERAGTVGVRTDASTRSALLMTGALYAPLPGLLVSLDNATTFAPGTDTETWQGTRGALSGVVFQQNRFNLSQSTTRMHIYQALRGDWYWVAGGAFRSLTFKRYGLDVLRPDLVVPPTQNVVDESVSELLAQGGIAWESTKVKSSPSHRGIKLTLGLPVWRRVENTNFINTRFQGTRGWDVGVEGRYSIAVHHKAHIGLWGQYQVSRRASEVKGALELPRMQLRSLACGVELLWKL